MGFEYKNSDKDATLPVIQQPAKNLINLILAFHSLKKKTFHRLQFNKKARNLQPVADEKSNFYLNFLQSMLKSFLLILLLTTFSCGVKGNPKPPPSITPKSVENLTIKQYDGRFLIYFNYNPLYTDDRQMKEDFKFIIYKNSKKFDTSLF